MRSELGAELRYLHAQLLHDDLESSSFWFEVVPGCTELGSFGVKRPARDPARLQIDGYGPVVDGFARPLIQKRVDLSFRTDRTVFADLTLNYACLGSTSRCSDEQTCGSDGACVEVPTVGERTSLVADAGPGCMTVLQTAPPFSTTSLFDPDASEPKPPRGPQDASDGVAEDPGERVDASVPDVGPVCASGDGVCAPCGYPQDLDCRRPNGDRCDLSVQCESLFCVDGYCCNGSCGENCSRCDLPTKQGLCWPRDLTSSDDPRNCGGCGLVCDGTGIEVMSCSAGECSGSCDKDRADCNRNKRSDGCETDTTTPTHCGDCTTACYYDFCDGQRCSFSTGGVAEEVGRQELRSGAMRGVLTTLNGLDKSIRALGAVVDPTLAGQRIRIALYTETDDSIGRPGVLEVATEAFAITDNAKSGLTLEGAGWRVEAKVPRTPVKPDAFYWIFVQVSAPTRFMTPETTPSEWVVYPSDFTDFPPLFPDASTETSAYIDLYAITTPD